MQRPDIITDHLTLCVSADLQQRLDLTVLVQNIMRTRVLCAEPTNASAVKATR